MPLPSGTVPVAPSAADTPPPPAFLVRFPEDTWKKLASADGQVTITVGDDMVSTATGKTMGALTPRADSEPAGARPDPTGFADGAAVGAVRLRHERRPASAHRRR